MPTFAESRHASPVVASRPVMHEHSPRTTSQGRPEAQESHHVELVTHAIAVQDRKQHASKIGAVQSASGGRAVAVWSSMEEQAAVCARAVIVHAGIAGDVPNSYLQEPGHPPVSPCRSSECRSWGHQKPRRR